jgi:hypothetical protein
MNDAYVRLLVMIRYLQTQQMQNLLVALYCYKLLLLHIIQQLEYSNDNDNRSVDGEVRKTNLLSVGMRTLNILASPPNIPDT